MNINEIYRMNCVEGMNGLEPSSVDLIFADPPYNLQLNADLHRPDQSKVAAVNDDWDKFASFDEYDRFTTEWLTAAYGALKDNGTIWVIGSYHNIFRVGRIMQDLGFWILNDIVWVKANPMPNFKGTRFNNAHETLIWASKGPEKRFTFHYKTMKASNDDKQMRSDWVIPICSGTERLKDNGVKIHSTQKPLSLLRRVILSSSNRGDVILDPFMGSGTTAAAAKELGRNYIGFELEDSYVKAARSRVAAVNVIDEKLLNYPIEVKNQRVPFGTLVTSGYLTAGDQLTSYDDMFSAYIRPDGTITSGELNGSIHKVSATLLNREANNGWTFWYIKREDNKILIDDIRKQYLENIKEIIEPAS